MEAEVLVTLGEIKGLVKVLSERMTEVERQLKEYNAFLVKWKFGFAILIGLCTIGAFVIGAWSGITSFLAWVQGFSHS